VKYTAVIFDLFGTLVDNFSVPGYETALVQMASVLSLPEDDFKRAWFETSRERNTGVSQSCQGDVELICRKLEIPEDEKQITMAVETRLNYIRQVMTPQPGALEVLSRLKEEGHKTGLISDCTHEIPVVWPDTPFAPLIDIAIFSCAVGLRKPDPRIYQLAVEQLDVNPEQCLYIGDGGSQELSGARQVGMYPVLIRHDADSSEPHLVKREQWDGPTVQSLSDILALTRDG